MKFTKILIIALVLVALVSIGAFSQDFSFGAGWESASLIAPAGPVLNVDFGIGGLDLNFFIKDFRFKDPTASSDYTYTENGVVQDSDSDSVEMPATFAFSTTAFAIGIGPYINFYKGNNWNLFAAAQLNYLLLSGKLDLKFQDDSSADYMEFEGNVNLPAFEVAPSVGISYKPFSAPIELSGSIGYSFVSLLPFKANLTSTYFDGTDTDVTEINGKIEPKALLDGTFSSFAIKVKF